MDVRMSFQYMLVLSPDEFRVVSKALRGSEMLESENKLALELQERMLTMKHAQLEEAVRQSSKHMANIAKGKEEA